jgi:hypothetical protein
MLLNFLKSFQNRRDWLLPAFKSGGHCAARFSKENCSSETCLPDFKTSQIAPCQLSKALGVSAINLLSNRSKGFDLTGFEKLSANSEAFGT